MFLRYIFIENQKDSINETSTTALAGEEGGDENY